MLDFEVEARRGTFDGYDINPKYGLKSTKEYKMYGDK
jgi:hypothetical protein